MAVLKVGRRALGVAVGRSGSTASCLLLVVSVQLLILGGGNPGLGIYLLSSWHYYLYWLAFAFGARAFDVFKRDAVVMKAISVATLATVYLAAPLDLASLAVIASGILLNVRAAVVLGIDRTYYGHEVAGLPARRVTAFPYSVTAHPMILGNVAAFGGTLINDGFRAQWWPLAGLHVALNIGLLVMELAGSRRRRAVRIGGGLILAGSLFAAILAGLGAGALATTRVGLADALLIAATVACAGALYRCYGPSASPLREKPQEIARRIP